jgi:hypothetical protein
MLSYGGDFVEDIEGKNRQKDRDGADDSNGDNSDFDVESRDYRFVPIRDGIITPCVGHQCRSK